MGKDKYKIEKDPFEIKTGQYSKFSKMCLKQTHQGDTYEEAIQKLGKLSAHIESKDLENARIELNNMIANLFHVYEEHHLDVYALSYMVKCDDKDEAAEWLKETYSINELKEISRDIKKKFLPSLS